jgi:uncharacterized phiE125 gp8 family phage protein
LRLDQDEEDAAILRLILAARELVERYTGRAFVNQSWRLWRDAWPDCPRMISIPKPPLTAIASVTAYDRSGTATTLSSDAYIVDCAAVPGRITFTDTAVLPADLREAKAIAIAFQAGYGAIANDVPAGIRAGLLSLIAHFYEARGDTARPSPDALNLLAPFRVMML